MDSSLASSVVRKLLLAAMVGVVAIPLPAKSEPLFSAKAEAILSGAPSRLAMISAQQSGQQLARPAALPIRAPAVRAAVSPDRPDVFGSVALKVARTPLDGRWHHVARSRVSGGAAAFAASLRGLGELERIETVNRYVNARVRFADDSAQFQVADRWLAAGETLRRGSGDCEDYAIAKLALLRAAGFADRDLYLVIARDLVRRADHAVLVVRSEGRLLLLDNTSDLVGDAAEAQDYRPVLTYSAGRSWTHGYRWTPREAAPAVMAAAPSPIAPLVPAAAPVAASAPTQLAFVLPSERFAADPRLLASAFPR